MPTGLTNVVAVAVGVGALEDELAVRADGTIVDWPGNFTPLLPGLSNVVAVGIGEQHQIALTGTMAPFLKQPLLPQTVLAGARTMFYANYNASGPVRFQWRMNGTNLPGATNNPLVLTGVTGSQAGNYSVVVSNSLGSVTASNGLLTVVSFLINTQPQSQTATVGSTVNFSVDLQSPLPLSYQWRLAGTNLPGATSNPLVLTNVALAQAGNYSVVISNSAGTVTSSNAALTVVPFVLNTQPQSQTNFAGSTVSFSVGCQSVLPLSYQWRLEGTNLPGATANPLVLPNVTLGQAGNYSVLITNSAGTATSSNALLALLPFVINTQPQSQMALVGNTVNLSVDCQSVLPLFYQWRLAGTNLPGATTNPLVLNYVALNQSGNYTVVVSNSAATAPPSAKAVVTVVPVAHWGYSGYGLTNFPADLSNVVAVAGGSSFSLALRSNGTVIAWGDGQYGETNVPPGLSGVVAVSADTEHGQALRNDGAVAEWGSYYSDNFFPPDFTLPANLPAGLVSVAAVASGRSHDLALRMDGTVATWGKWGAGGMGMFIDAPLLAGLSNAVGVACGNDASLVLRADGSVVAWGRSSWLTNIPAGISNVVSVAAGGGQVLALVSDGTVITWGGAGTNLPGGLSNVIAVAVGYAHSLALRSDGSVVAWGANYSGQTNVPPWVVGVGSIAGGGSHSLAVPALGPPFITSRLTDRVGAPGGRNFFTVQANGARPLSYQWRRNGLDLPGDTSAVLPMTGLSAADEGDYTVIVSNRLGVATIPSARLSVARTPLQLALDNTLQWSVGGTVSWFPETAVTHDGVDAAQSGAITNSQESWLQTSVVGPGNLSFWWKVSSEQDYDFLELSVDGGLQPGRISGEVAWQQQTVSIPAGTHTLRWRYSKDVADSVGQDAAWVDEVSFTGTAPLQFVTTGGGLTVSNGACNLRLTGSAGVNVVVDRSFNLTNWTPVQTNTLPLGGLNLTMPVGTNVKQFFRARIP